MGEDKGQGQIGVSHQRLTWVKHILLWGTKGEPPAETIPLPKPCHGNPIQAARN